MRFFLFTFVAPGQPGITAYKYPGSEPGKYLIPPSIAGKYTICLYAIEWCFPNRYVAASTFPFSVHALQKNLNWKSSSHSSMITFSVIEI